MNELFNWFRFGFVENELSSVIVSSSWSVIDIRDPTLVLEAHLIVLCGLILPLLCSLQVVPTSFWLPLPQLVMLGVLDWNHTKNFGKGYGSCVYPTKSSTLFGDPATMLSTKCNLFYWQITTSDTYELYNGVPKHDLHAFWLCKEVESEWSAHNWFQQSVSSLLWIFVT